MRSRFMAVLMMLVLMVAMFAGCSKETEVVSEVSGTAETTEITVDFPTKTITAICPWSAGGGTDTILRGLTKSTESVLGQTITVTNKTGGGGAVGHAAIMAAPNDGYNVGMITFELNSLPPQGLVDFNYEDFEPLMRVNMDAAAITVPVDAPYDTIAEFVEYAKAHPGEVTIGNAGAGSVWHVAGGLLAEAADIEVVYVPFDGGAPAVTALVGGHIEAVSVSAAEVQGQVQAGDLKVLAVMSSERLDLFPEVPTMNEEGIDLVFGTWRGLAVPIGTPQEIKDILIDGFKEGLESPEFVKYANDAGLLLAYQGPEEFADFVAANAKDVEVVMNNLGLAAQ